MTEKQFQIFCKVIYRVTLVTLVLQIVACVMMFWMFWKNIPEYQDVLILLGGSVLASFVYLSAKKSFFKREEVGLGLGGTTGIMHPLHINIMFWVLYFFFELVFVLGAIHLYIKAVWL